MTHKSKSVATNVMESETRVMYVFSVGGGSEAC
jgi:hypothetical protein